MSEPTYDEIIKGADRARKFAEETGMLPETLDGKSALAFDILCMAFSSAFNPPPTPPETSDDRPV